MSTKDKKLFVLHRLSQRADFIALSDLLKELGQEYAERSVRRWLAEMVEEGIVERSGQKKNSLYKVINRNHREAGKSGPFGTSSLRIIQEVRKPLYERSPISYSDEWFKLYQPNVTYYLSASSRDQLHKAGKRLGQDDPAGTYAHQIFNRLLIDLSYNSSRLEGNTYSLLDTERLVLEGTGAEGKLDEEKIMILNHKEAIRYMVDNASKIQVSKEIIFTLHYLLSDGLVEAHYAGKIRDHAVRIGGSTYIPFEDKRELETRFNRIIEKAADIQDPFEQSLFLLAHITYLQAFSAVNKRTARLSANIPLIKNNWVPLSFNDVDREDYTSAIISIYELQDIRPLVDLYVFSYLRTCAMYDSTAKAIGYDEIRVRYRQQRRALLREIVLQKMTEDTIQAYISTHLPLIKSEDKQAFIEDLREDLNGMDQNNIGGLGMTSDQLSDWLDAQQNKRKNFPI